MGLDYSKYILEKEHKQWSKKLENLNEGLDESIKSSAIERIKARLSDLEEGIQLINKHLY